MSGAGQGRGRGQGEAEVQVLQVTEIPAEYTEATNVVLEVVEEAEAVEEEATDAASCDEEEEDMESEETLADDGPETEEPDLEHDTDAEVLCEDNIDSAFRREMLAGWTIKEKYELHKALKFCDSSDRERLQKCFPHKTPKEIDSIIRYYSNRAAEKMKATAHNLTTRRHLDRSTQKPRDMSIPLVSWKRALEETYTPTDLQTATADALRIIADCEYFPKANQTSDIDFRQLYSTLADSLDNRNKNNKINKENMATLRRAFTQVAHSCRHLANNGGNEHISHIKSLLPFIGPFVDAPVRNEAEVRIRNLLVQRNYNPLRVPERLLQPNVELKNEVSHLDKIL